MAARVRCVGRCKVCLACACWEGNPEALSFAVEPFSSLCKAERWDISGLLPNDVGVGELLQKANLSYDAVLVHVVFVDLHHHHLPIGDVHHLKDIRVC